LRFTVAPRFLFRAERPSCKPSRQAVAILND
jgi:hypothetical protein